MMRLLSLAFVGFAVLCNPTEALPIHKLHRRVHDAKKAHDAKKKALVHKKQKSKKSKSWNNVGGKMTWTDDMTLAYGFDQVTELHKTVASTTDEYMLNGICAILSLEWTFKDLCAASDSKYTRATAAYLQTSMPNLVSLGRPFYASDTGSTDWLGTLQSFVQGQSLTWGTQVATTFSSITTTVDGLGDGMYYLIVGAAGSVNSAHAMAFKKAGTAITFFDPNKGEYTGDSASLNTHLNSLYWNMAGDSTNYVQFTPITGSIKTSFCDTANTTPDSNLESLIDDAKSSLKSTGIQLKDLP